METIKITEVTKSSDIKNNKKLELLKNELNSFLNNFNISVNYYDSTFGNYNTYNIKYCGKLNISSVNDAISDFCLLRNKMIIPCLVDKKEKLTIDDIDNISYITESLIISLSYNDMLFRSIKNELTHAISENILYGYNENYFNEINYYLKKSISQNLLNDINDCYFLFSVLDNKIKNNYNLIFIDIQKYIDVVKYPNLHNLITSFNKKVELKNENNANSELSSPSFALLNFNKKFSNNYNYHLEFNNLINKVNKIDKLINNVLNDFLKFNKNYNKDIYLYNSDVNNYIKNFINNE